MILFGAQTVKTSENFNFDGLFFGKSTFRNVFLITSVTLWFKLPSSIAWDRKVPSKITSFGNQLPIFSMFFLNLASGFPFSGMFLGEDGISLTCRYLPGFRMVCARDWWDQGSRHRFPST